MPEIVLEQALFRRDHEKAPVLEARSSGFADDWLPEADRLMEGFGARTGGVNCPLALFAQPFHDRYVAIVRAADQEADASGWPAMAFHFLIVERLQYVRYLGDPFAVAERSPVAWGQRGDLPVLSWPEESLPARTLGQVQAVLKRIKAGALPEDFDPTVEMERTVENSESPALLGGTQVLVDGGKLIFIRKGPDQSLVQGLWTLLPNSLRGRIWPASFAFSNDLHFDVVVTPRFGEEDWEGYTTEEQACDYPAGSYELALQHAAEGGTQADLESVFARRTGSETLRLAWKILLFMIVLVIGSQLFVGKPPQHFTRQRQIMISSGIVAAAAGDPWSALSMYQAGKLMLHVDESNQR